MTIDQLIFVGLNGYAVALESQHAARSSGPTTS